MASPTERFTLTVQNYLKCRPSYPKEIITLLSKECGLTKEHRIADIGSGTGLLTKLFLDHGNVVYGVEPNQAMREAGEAFLKHYPNFHSIAGRAEATPLPDKSVDFITVGTAFHWFEPGPTKIEFRRILKSPGHVALIWNVRDVARSKLLVEYEQLVINYGKDYINSKAQTYDVLSFDESPIVEFFQPYKMHLANLEQRQYFDWQGLQGRLLSASYSLREGDPRYEEMIQALRTIFDRYQHNNQVEFLYATKIYYGQFC